MVRRFRRSMRRRRPSGIRRARRVLKRSKFRRIKKQRRKQRKKAYLYGYSFANHLDGAAGIIEIDRPEPDALNISQQTGLFCQGDAHELFQQVKNIDDFVFPNMTGTGTLGYKAGRQNLNIRAKGEITYTIANGNGSGAIWLEVYVCKPRKGISNRGIGVQPSFDAVDVLEFNRNSAFVNDYNDAAGIAITPTTNAIANTTVQTKPTINATNFLVTPYMIPPFTENFKVIKQHKFVIPPGGQCMVKVKTPWTNISRQSYQLLGTNAGGSATSFGMYRPWFGRDIFFRYHGQPVHDTTDNELVNYGKAVLNVVAVKRYWFNHSLRPLPSYVLQANTNQGEITNAVLPSGGENPVDDAK